MYSLHYNVKESCKGFHLLLATYSQYYLSFNVSMVRLRLMILRHDNIW